MPYSLRSISQKRAGYAQFGKDAGLQITFASRCVSKAVDNFRAEMQRTQFNRYCIGEITKPDTDILARMCGVLHCEIGELLEFVPYKKADTAENFSKDNVFADD